MSLIRIDYENARAQARQLEQSEQQCSQIAQSIQALRQQLAGVWAGEAADTYDQAAERRRRMVRRLCRCRSKLNPQSSSRRRHG